MMRRYLFHLILTLLLGSTLIVGFNVYVDPYRVIRSVPDTAVGSRSELNTRVVKFEHLSAQCKQIDAVVFGTSRSVGYRTDFIRERFGLNAYNMGVSNESYFGVLKKFKWLVDHGCSPRMIFIPISPDHISNYGRDFSLPPFDLLRMDSPQIVDDFAYTMNFYRSYLFSFTALSTNFKALLHAGDSKENLLNYNFRTGDTYYLWDESFPIKKCPGDSGYSFTKAEINQALDLLREIADIADKNTIKVVLLWNPEPITTQTGDANIGDFLKQLAPVFSSIYRIPLVDNKLRDSGFYHDQSHFKDVLAREVLRPENEVGINTLIEELTGYNQACLVSGKD